MLSVTRLAIFERFLSQILIGGFGNWLLKGSFKTKTKRFWVRLAGFSNMIKLSLQTKWPRITQKRRIFVVM